MQPIWETSPTKNPTPPLIWALLPISGFVSCDSAIRFAGARVSMKILLDECVPWPMHKLLAGHECTTAQKCGWGGIKNGELLRLAESRFELFITSDQNICCQQNLGGFRIAIHAEISKHEFFLRIVLLSAMISKKTFNIGPAWQRVSQTESDEVLG